MAKSPSETFKERLKEARNAAGLSLSELAERLKDLGHGMHLTALQRIEKGERKVTIDEAVEIAAALDVSPLHLIFPIDGEDVRLAPSLIRDFPSVRAWAQGKGPLNPAEQNVRFYFFQSPSSWEELEIMRQERGIPAPESTSKSGDD